MSLISHSYYYTPKSRFQSFFISTFLFRHRTRHLTILNCNSRRFSNPLGHLLYQRLVPSTVTIPSIPFYLKLSLPSVNIIRYGSYTHQSHRAISTFDLPHPTSPTTSDALFRVQLQGLKWRTRYALISIWCQRYHDIYGS